MKYENLNECLAPYWEGLSVHRESVLFSMDKSGAPLPAALLYPPTQIISVESATLEMEYTPGKDFLFTDGKLEWLPGSRIPCQRFETLYPDLPMENASFEKTGGGHIYFSEGDVFHRMQTVVTYLHGNRWTGPIPENKAALLPRTSHLLNSSPTGLGILVLGDSITEGANSSGPIGAPPHLGSWWQLAAAFLEKKYQKAISCEKVAMGGQISSWGAERAREAAFNRPDLVIIAFGMNDGTHKVPPAEFKENILAIIHTFRAADPSTEFILIGSILPNPEAKDFVGYQKENRDRLLELQGPGIAAADVTSMHEALLQHKPYRDMSGNNVNHMNDFLARLQAQVMLRTMGVL